MKKFEVTTVRYGGINADLVRETEVVEAQSAEQIYRERIDTYYIDLVAVYVKDVNVSLEADITGRCFVVDKVYVPSMLADVDYVFQYKGREYRSADSVEALLDEIERTHEYQVPHFIQHADSDEFLLWVESMREFACK